MVAVCVTTKIVNLQMMEGKHDESGAVAGFKMSELDYLDLLHQLHNQHGISFSICPVSGHHQHGLVERVIRSIQESFLDYKLEQKRMHSMGWQTFCKLAEMLTTTFPLGSVTLDIRTTQNS